MKVFRSQLFMASFVALRISDPTLLEVVAADIKYLIDRRHDALLASTRLMTMRQLYPYFRCS
jgi:hypothetical protein